ncbi:hypothetical protein [Paraburkholderia youngii]|uniref:hypothetical protein n=1 Tax=Paraburkholderia youngii TaxID=2782701 RepID=UPI003D250AB0
MEEVETTSPGKMTKRATGAKAAKAELLCIPRSLRDEVALGYHMSLACLRSPAGAVSQLAKIGEALMLSNFLLDAGFGRGSLQILAEAQNAILAVQFAGQRNGRWSATDPALWKPMAKLLVLLDEQLARAPSSQLLRAIRRYEAATQTQLKTMSDERLLDIAA